MLWEGSWEPSAQVDEVLLCGAGCTSALQNREDRWSTVCLHLEHYSGVVQIFLKRSNKQEES